MSKPRPHGSAAGRGAARGDRARRHARCSPSAATRGASIDEIARRSGVSPPVVYDHFASKQDLYMRLLERTRDELLEMWREHLSPATTGGRADPARARRVGALRRRRTRTRRGCSSARRPASPRCRRSTARCSAQARAALGAILGREPEGASASPARPTRRRSRWRPRSMRAGLDGARDLVERPPPRPARADRRDGGQRPVDRLRAGAGDVMRVERAQAAQVDAIRAIGAAYGNLEDWSVRPDPLDFELAAGGLWVALDDGAVAGFAGVVRHGATAHLADLFIDRDRRGGGIGRALLDAALPRAGTRIIFASDDPRALPLYARAGVRPLAPLLYLEGMLPTPEGAPSAARRAPATTPRRPARGRRRRRGRVRARARRPARVPRRRRRLRPDRRRARRVRDRATRARRRLARARRGRRRRPGRVRRPRERRARARAPRPARSAPGARAAARARPARAGPPTRTWRPTPARSTSSATYPSPTWADPGG